MIQVAWGESDEERADSVEEAGPDCNESNDLSVPPGLYDLMMAMMRRSYPHEHASAACSDDSFFSRITVRYSDLFRLIIGYPCLKINTESLFFFRRLVWAVEDAS